MPHFVTTRRIEFCDTDMAGIVHFANFFRFMEAAEVAFLRTLGLSVTMDWEGQALGFPRRSATCDYLKPAYFEDLIDIQVSLDNLGGKSVTYAFEFSRQGETLARGKVTSVCCRVLPGHKLEAMAIPPGVRDKILQFMKP